MWIFLKLNQFILWIIVTAIHKIIRNIIWKITGIENQLRNNHRPDAYKGTAQILSIWARHALDEGSQPANQRDFLTTHVTFDDPDVVLQDHVTLYALTEQEAVFVEVPIGCDVSNSNVSPFYRIAQFRNARRVIVLPLHVFHKLAERIGPPQAKLIFITHTSRCGSTLLGQVFEETRKAIVFSEPDITRRLTTYRKSHSTAQFERRTRHVINILCKSRRADIDCFVIKFELSETTLVPYLAKLYPDAYFLFMYRHGFKVAQSLVKASTKWPLTMIGMNVSVCSMRFGLAVDRWFQLTELRCPMQPESYIQLCTMVWAQQIQLYETFRAQGKLMA